MPSSKVSKNSNNTDNPAAFVVVEYKDENETAHTYIGSALGFIELLVARFDDDSSTSIKVVQYATITGDVDFAAWVN